MRFISFFSNHPVDRSQGDPFDGMQFSHIIEGITVIDKMRD
jgi:hypothetical protein